MRFNLSFEVDNDFYRKAENPEEVDMLAVSMTLKDVAENVRKNGTVIVRDEHGEAVGEWSINNG